MSSPVLLCTEYSGESTLQILRLINSSEIPKIILKLLVTARLCAGNVNGDHLIIFIQFVTWKCNLKTKNFFLLCQKVWIGLNSNIISSHNPTKEPVTQK